MHKTFVETINLKIIKRNLKNFKELKNNFK